MGIPTPVVENHTHQGGAGTPGTSPHALTHMGGADPITPAGIGAAAASHNQAAETITSGTLSGARLPAMSEGEKGAVPATGVPAKKFLADLGSFADIVDIASAQPASPFSKSLWYNTPNPAATVFAMQLREHRYYLANNPVIAFSKPAASSIKCASSAGSVAYGFVFVSIPKALIDGNKVKLTWATNRSETAAFFARIVDGDFNRKSESDFPDGSTHIAKGTGALQTIEDIAGTQASHTATITANLAASVLDNVTIKIYLIDGSITGTADFTISALEITDLSDVVLYSADLAGALNMESEGGVADYGMIGEGTVDYVDRPLPNLKYYDQSAGVFKNMAEPFHAGGLVNQYQGGDKNWHDLNAAAVANTPSGLITETDMQGALNGLETRKEPVTIIKTDTGDPSAPAAPVICINTFDNNVKIYADGAWRTLATW